jgi:uncharacterized protein
MAPGPGAWGRDATRLRAVAGVIARSSPGGYNADHLARRLRGMMSEPDKDTPVSDRFKPRGSRTAAVRARPPSFSEFLDAVRAKDAVRCRQMLDVDPTLATSVGPDGLGPLTAAGYAGAAEIAALLKDRGARPSIHEATILDDRELVRRMLLARPPLVGSFSPDGWTPLHLAAHFGRGEIARELLERHAPIDAVARNGIGNQPLEAAVAGGHVGLVRTLLAAGADPDHRSHGGLTALHAAAYSGDLSMVRLLVSAGADVDAAMEGGKTALDLATEQGRTEVVDWLSTPRKPRTGPRGPASRRAPAGRRRARSGTPEGSRHRTSTIK